MKKINSKVNIITKKKNLGKREWGKEDLLVLIPKVLSLKLLKIKKNKEGGLQYHRKKNECGYILEGKLKMTFQNSKGILTSKILKKGSSFHIPPGAIHQERALTDCLIIEASTPHFNDRVRVEKKFNLPQNKGLPTTSLKEILLK